MKPYYQDEKVTLYHGDSREIMSGMEDESVRAVLTDPPYTERTHSKARKNTAAGIGHGITTFGSITDDELESILAECGRVSQGWVVATLDYHHAVRFDGTPPPGLKCQRVGVG